MQVHARRAGTLSTIAQLGNPVFIILSIVLPNAALGIAMALGSLMLLNYVHIMTGALWTGIDLFMGFAVGPVLGAMEPRQRAEFFKRLIPKMTFLMPMLAGATIIAGIHLAQQTGRLSLDSPWIVAALVITAILVIQGFGILLRTRSESSSNSFPRLPISTGLSGLVCKTQDWRGSRDCSSSRSFSLWRTCGSRMLYQCDRMSHSCAPEPVGNNATMITASGQQTDDR